MRQINFLIIFTICLALVIFSLENIQPTALNILPGVEVQAPLAIELILTTGIGAVLAWLYGGWNQIQHQLQTAGEKRQMNLKDEQIWELEQDIERYKAEIEKHRQLLPSFESASEDGVALQSYYSHSRAGISRPGELPD